MNNTQFKEYIEGKLKAVNEQIRDLKDPTKQQLDDLKAQQEMLVSAHKIMTYGTGPERRRFRRDYERRLAR